MVYTIIKKIIDWFQKHDKLAHFLGCMITTLALGGIVPYGTYISALLWILIEVAQIIKWGVDWKDMILDLVADALGWLTAHAVAFFILALTLKF